jgi:hypothetical protein
VAFKVVDSNGQTLAYSFSHRSSLRAYTLAVGKIGGRQGGRKDHDPLYPNVSEYHIFGQAHKPTGTSSLERCLLGGPGLRELALKAR